MSCRFRIPEHIVENHTFTFRAGFPNQSGGVTYFGDQIDIPVNSGAAISKPVDNKGGLEGGSVRITPSGVGGSGFSGSGYASVGARDISGGNFGGGNPSPFVAGSKKMLTKEEYFIKV